MLGVFAFVVFGYLADRGLIASIGSFANINSIAESEKTFTTPRNVQWTGEIIGVVSGGSCVGIKGNFSGYPAFLACLPDIYGTGLSNYSGIVTVNGKWSGITCAYRNTIFGSCVPDVVIERINL